ncbi:TPA: hypothetical protein N0F65_000555 [Lagenidium giganteum]|uniref:Ndc10 domain-containing protein n=1 Tax=Lagenidium giganteum TaxID=4803 RepID=A0AAV2Z417_9STRA|nr:TPA: hypothetical protein N0F65_000555 [Lagenidium giganteum]
MVNKAFAAVGVNSKKKIHAPRGSAVRKAESAGCKENQMRGVGRWNADAMNQAYLTNLPLQPLRACTGFNPKGGSCFLPLTCVGHIRVQEMGGFRCFASSRKLPCC